MLGYGQSADAYDLVAVAPDGNGVRLALERAFASAGIAPGDVDYINAHGTSTPIGDPAESKAIEQAFGEHAKRIGVSSTKSMHGHALGAAGGLEGVATVLSVVHDIMPPTINAGARDEECDYARFGNEGTGARCLLPFEWQGGARRRSAMASTLLACLELARDGKVELQQMAPFEEIFVRDRAEPREPLPDAGAVPGDMT